MCRTENSMLECALSIVQVVSTAALSALVVLVMLMVAVLSWVNDASTPSLSVPDDTVPPVLGPGHDSIETIRPTR
jgi:hypothetical protein